MFWNGLAINLKRPLTESYGQKMSPQFGRFEEPFKVESVNITKLGCGNSTNQD